MMPCGLTWTIRPARHRANPPMPRPPAVAEPDAEPDENGRRVITFRDPPPRFDALLRKLSETFPAPEETP